MTNREWINTLTDEELADLICFKTGISYEAKAICYFDSSSKGVLLWLKEEHKEETE